MGGQSARCRCVFYEGGQESDCGMGGGRRAGRNVIAKYLGTGPGAFTSQTAAGQPLRAACHSCARNSALSSECLDIHRAGNAPERGRVT